MAVKLDTKFKRLARQDRLVPHLDKAIGDSEYVWEYAYEPKGHDDAWHPSSDCMPSLRDLYLMGTGQVEKAKHPAALMKTFQVGHFWHQYLQYLIQHKLQFCDGASIERVGIHSWGDGPYKWVRGQADVAPIEIPQHGEFLLDIKTMNSHDFRNPSAPLWAVDKWECQMNVYLDLFDLDRALILGVQKDSPHEFKEFLFTKNQPLIDALYTKWQLVGECIEAGVEPPASEEVELPLKGPQ